jgi:phosphate transport system permease protein
MTQLEFLASDAATASVATSPSAEPDRPRTRRRLGPGALWEAMGSVVASAATAFVLFQFLAPHAWGGMIVCWVLGVAVFYGVVSRIQHGARIAKDRLATVVIWVGAAVALFPLLEIIINVIIQGVPVVFGHFPAFLVHDQSTAGLNAPVWEGGMGHAIVGTIEQVGLATIYTVPISLLTAIYLSESTSWFSRLVRTIVDSMMGTPSIIAGIFVYLFWVQPRGSSGFSGFAASIALAILMLPVMIRTAEEVIRVVPGSLREAALALGSPRWRVSLRVVLPTVRAGLLTATILGVALAVGETAPTLFTAHGAPRYNFNPFSGPQANLPLQALQNIESLNNTQVRQGWGGAFILVSMVLSLFVLARLVSNSKPGRLRRIFRLKQKEVAVS